MAKGNYKLTEPQLVFKAIYFLHKEGTQFFETEKLAEKIFEVEPPYLNYKIDVLSNGKNKKLKILQSDTYEQKVSKAKYQLNAQLKARYVGEKSNLAKFITDGILDIEKVLEVLQTDSKFCYDIENEPLISNLIIKSNTDQETTISVESINESKILHLPKPFIILAGISGTGKTRIIRNMAGVKGKTDYFSDSPNVAGYYIEPVRPDWHEPSDLVGYISRISEKKEYITPGFLTFIISAWRNIQKVTGLTPSEIANKELEVDAECLSRIKPYWLCLDEMNLAPVELYLADYLSILETRVWKYRKTEDGKTLFTYSTDPLIKPTVFAEFSDEEKHLLKNKWYQLCKNNDVDSSIDRNAEKLFNDFITNGITLPFNLIVAGTVNMDETTHSFSRKVLDRALSFDFTEFFPNNFDDYLNINDEEHSQQSQMVVSYATHSDGIDLRSIESGILTDESLNQLCITLVDFLKSVNYCALKDTPFELGFRALNELFLYTLSYKNILAETTQKISPTFLTSVLDDFVMTKILPRIEGDSDKLCSVVDKKDRQLSITFKSEDFDLSVLHDFALVLIHYLIKINGIQLDHGTEIISNQSDFYNLMNKIIDSVKRYDLLNGQDGSYSEEIKLRSLKKIKWMLGKLEKTSYTGFWR